MTAQLPLFASRGSTCAWHVRVSERARRLSVRVYPGGRVEVVVPPGVSARVVQRFVGEHRGWIERRSHEFATAVAADISQPHTIALSALAREFAVSYEAGTGAVRLLRVNGAHLRLAGAVHDRVAVAAALRRWLMLLARQELGQRLQSLAREIGLDFRCVQVRRQRTRWGSCSVSGTISLNACLVFQEPDVLRYLIIHELCHTRHLNHSRRFWALVERFEPDYRRLDRELTRGWQRVPAWMF